MHAQFVSLAVGYAIGGGVLRRKGARRRPWLELRRLETEATYLDHQVRALRKAGCGTTVVDVDMVSGVGFYDVRRARLQSPLLERAMEILCPDGTPQITPLVLTVAGERGLASLWIDRGYWDGRWGVLRLEQPDDAAHVHGRLTAEGLRLQRRDGSRTIRIEPQHMDELARFLRPHVHRSMRYTLRPGSIHGGNLLRRNPL